MTYHEYIMSRQWREHPARLAELAAWGFRCRLCNDDGSESPLEVHHRTYANLFNEQAGDLTTLCRGCHRVVTDHQRRLRYADVLPKTVDIRPGWRLRRRCSTPPSKIWSFVMPVERLRVRLTGDGRC